MWGNIWKINFESALFVTMMERESKLCVHLLLSYFCLFNFKFSTLFAPYHNQAFQCFCFLFFFPATLPTVCLRLYNAVTIYSRLIKYNDRTGWTDMNLSKLSAVERLHELKGMQRSLLISAVSSRHSSHGQILCPHVFHYHSFLCFIPRVTVNLPVSLYTWWFLGFLPIHDKCRA